MSSIRKKAIIAAVYLSVTTFVAGLIAVFSYVSIEMLQDSKNNFNQLDSFISTYDLMSDAFNETFESTQNSVEGAALLTASAIRYSGIELKPQKYSRGYIVRKTKNGIRTPEGFPVDDQIIEILLSDESAESDYTYDNGSFIIYAKISGDYYYVEQYDGTFFTNEIIDALDPSVALENLARAGECDYILFYINKGDLSDTGEDDDLSWLRVSTATGRFKDCENISEAGLSKSDIIDSGKDPGAFGGVTIDGAPYLISSILPEDGSGLCAVMLIDESTALRRAVEQTLTIVVIIILICITMIVWILSVFRTVRDKTLTYEENLRYRPDSLRRKVIAFIIACAILLHFGSLFTQALECLYMHSHHSTLYLSEYFNRLDDDALRMDTLLEHSQIKYHSNARRVARLLDNDPSLRNQKWLREASDIIGADYIMVFDTKGDEELCSAGYKGMSLGKDDSYATYDFRRLIRGAEYIFLGNVTDETTGVVRDLHGISLSYNSTDKAYGALVIAVKPNDQYSDVLSNYSGIADIMTPADDICFGVDPETGVVKYSSDDALLDMKVSEIGMKSVPLSSDYMGYLTIDGIDYYAISDQYNGDIFYYGVPKSDVFYYTRHYARVCVILFLLIAAGLALILLRGYTQEVFNKYADISISEQDTDDDKDADPAKDIKPSGRKKNRYASSPDLLRAFRKDLSPADRAHAAGSSLFLVYIAIIVAVILRSYYSDSTTSSIIGYITHGNWDRGLNMFAAAAVLLLLFVMIMFMFLLRCLTSLLTRILSEQDLTMFLLLINVLHYAVLIAFVFISLGFLGVNTGTIVASAGLVGLALTLGANDFIADTLAGITTVVDGTYRIGDVIEIAGFRGEVSRMGLRSTTLIGRGKNVKTFRNSKIVEVINYSRMNSWYPLILSVSSEQSLDELEKMLEEELPAIGEKYPEIISGPRYRGVDSISGAKTNILILTECDQLDFSKVQREVNHDVLLLFEKHGIRLI